MLPTHCTRGCGCIGHPAFSAPSVSRARFFSKPRAFLRCGIAVVCSRAQSFWCQLGWPLPLAYRHRPQLLPQSICLRGAGQRFVSEARSFPGRDGCRGRHNSSPRVLRLRVRASILARLLIVRSSKGGDRGCEWLGEQDRGWQTRPTRAAAGEEWMTTMESAGSCLRRPDWRNSRSRAYDRNGRLQSLAGAARGALHPSLHRHGLRLQRVLAAAVARDRADRAEGLPGHVAGAGAVHHHLRLAGRQHGLDVHAVFRAARRLGGDLGRLAGARRSAQGRLRRGAVLGRRPADRRASAFTSISSG